jgi:hypothetical protein
MNEQIKKLAKQCTTPEHFDVKTFTELIVKECGEVAYKAYWDNPETVKGIHIQEKIKEHFGIEE